MDTMTLNYMFFVIDKPYLVDQNVTRYYMTQNCTNVQWIYRGLSHVVIKANPYE